MIPELGHFSLILALFFSVFLGVLPLIGVHYRNLPLTMSAKSLATGQALFVLIAFTCLITAFLQDDFSVAYVAHQSNSLMPYYYKISATWGGHEGSLLLWMLMLSGWTFSIVLFSKSLPLDMQVRVLAIMGLVAVGFLSFILFTSNPFDRLLPMFPPEGSDLNPLLQDIGLIIHPPILYMGYVGFSTVFAFAIAALLTGKLDGAWARWSRPWATTAWAFLTVGIALGSWWAYYELGWGGWWFWDPVENASFMPWLVGTALVHSLAVTEKRGYFKSWTILLAIITFSLSLLGTFLVRSGVLTSVHAFANDPERGFFILGFLTIVVGSSLTLFGMRAPIVKNKPGFSVFSREALILCNNILLIIMMVVILFGTLFPLLADAFEWGKYSVGAPFFNLTFLPFMTLICLLMGLVPVSRWKNTKFRSIGQFIRVPVGISLFLTIFIPLVFSFDFLWQTLLATFIASWIAFSTVFDLFQKTKNSLGFWFGFRRLSLSYLGMVVAHIGIAVTVIGVSYTSNYSDETIVVMEVSVPQTIAGKSFTIETIDNIQGANYVAQQAVISIVENDRLIARLRPEKRRYIASGKIMSEVSIDPGLTRDIYVALGDKLSDKVWSVRVHTKILVRWIWLGALLMAFGGVLAVIDKRYRKVT